LPRRLSGLVATAISPATMASAAIPSPDSRPRPLALSWWLLFVAALVLAMVVVGGITRLTESGLSIVKWEPISGALPPLNDSSGRRSSRPIAQSPQYQLVNSGMSLADFKTIFFWEYVHRLLGRAIGLVFALPLALVRLEAGDPQRLWLEARRDPRARRPAGGDRLVDGRLGPRRPAGGEPHPPRHPPADRARHLLRLPVGRARSEGARRRSGARPARMPTIGIWALSASSSCN
jgi:cytochrome c oxidase assembly protein subunit 15